MIEIAQDHAHVLFNMGILSTASAGNLYCNEYANWMDNYQEQLKHALLKQVNREQNHQQNDETSSSSAVEELFHLRDSISS